MRSTILLLLVLLPWLAFAQATTPAEGTRIARVEVTGTNRLRPVEVENTLSMRAGSEFSQAAYRRDLQALADFKNVDPIASKILLEDRPGVGLVLVVSVVENPVIRSISVIGNVKYKRATLVSQLDYKIGDILPTGYKAATVRNMKRFYADGGYKAAGVTVESLPATDAEGGVNLSIIIEEGVRIKVRKLLVTGNSYYSDWWMGFKIVNAPGFLFFNNYFDEKALDDDVATITAMYRNAGYLDVSVQKGTPIYSEKDLEVTVLFNVEEGPRYVIDAVGYEGVTYFTEKELGEKTERLLNKIYSGDRMEKAIDGLRELYGNQGYVDTEITNRIEKNVEARTAKIVFVMNESPAIYTGRIILNQEDYRYDIDQSALDEIMNNLAPQTKDETVLREVRLKSGTKYRTADEVRTRERLKNLGIFRKVEVNRIPTADPSVRDVEIKTEEDPSAAFVGVTAGIGEQSGPALTFSIELPNVGGKADKFRASATIGTRNQAYRVGYFDRYLGESNVSMDSQLYSTADRYRAVRERTLGGSVEFGKPLSERLTGYFRTRLERVDYSGYKNSTETDLDGYYVAAVRPYLTYDARDNIFYPTRGYLIGGGVETGAADGFMVKAMHNYEAYQRIGKSDFIYAYQHTVGLMPYDADNIGLSERFFVGGPGNLRGFKYREVGPRDDGNRFLATGGATRLTQRHEVRYPFNDFLKGRVFADAAILESGPLEVGTPRIGSGVGVSMDLGPVVVDVDLATPILKERRDQAQYFHLRIGSDF